MPRRTQPLVAFIAEVLVSDAVAAKIRAAGELDPAEVVSVLQSPPPRVGRWVRDDRGARLLVRARTKAGNELLAVLYPVGSDAWRLASAHVQRRQRRA